MSATRRQVAREAGVSESTVSYVINNGPRPVAEATRQRVLEVIERLGYQPNGVAQSLRRKQTTMIGLIVPDTANPYYGEIARVIENACDAVGYTVMMGNSGGSQIRVERYLEQLTMNRVAGMIYIPTGDHDPTEATLHSLSRLQIPCIVLDYPTPLLPCILADQPQMGYLATRHLIDLGHRRIGYVARNVDNITRLDRFAGYQAALTEAGIPFDRSLVMAVGELPEDGMLAGRYLLTLPEPVTAIFAHNDMNAIGVLRVARNLGWRVPEDLSLVGCDNISLSAFVDPPLTTIAHSIDDLGTQAVHRLIRLIRQDTPEDASANGQHPESALPAPLPAWLIVRASTAPVLTGG